tara:strand:- start:509 stop:841 length:333 start_codon:yes stop_codon:yes gene_type:complete
MNKILEYILLFLVGGCTVSGIKYVSTIAGPSYAAILGALPIGILTSITLKNVKIIDHYIENYAAMSLILLLVALFYHILIMNKVQLNVAYGLTIIAWLVLATMKMKYVKI